MEVNVTLASWSMLLIYSAGAVYALAFIVYAFDLFGGKKKRTGKAAGSAGASAGAATKGAKRTARTR
ncbi:c-type cytochrome biogenesis protein CcsB, partial [Brevibacterium paucivorans]